MSRVGIIADTHFPFTDRRYIPFIIRTFEHYKVDTYLHIGDLLDMYHCSRFVHNPNELAGTREMASAQRYVDRLKSVYPEMLVCSGNHERRVVKRAEEGGILTATWLRTFAEALDTPGWNWRLDHRIDGTLYTHGDNRSGMTGCRALALSKSMSACMGHTHRYAGIHLISQQGRRNTIFGMNVGCGVDKKSFAYNYAVDTTEWVHACGVVIDGDPIVVPM